MIKWNLRSLEKFLPIYAVIPLICCFSLNSLVYWGSMLINENRFHYDFTSRYDNAFPFIPEFIYIYFGCFVFWAFNYIYMSRLGEKHFYKFVTADMMSRLVCGIFFILFPTTNVRPEVIGHSITAELVRSLYLIDKPENLFPSIHCLVSWFCYIGIRGKKEVPFWYRAFSCIAAFSVFISTLATKQHFIIDIIGGVVIAEVMYFISQKTNLYLILMKVFTLVNNKIKKSLKI